MGKSPHSFTISRVEDGGFEGDGLRDYFEYRDLGIKGATGGEFGAHVIRARKPVAGGTGKHRHQLGFQMVYLLKGKCTMWYDGEGTFDLEPGDSLIQPPGILHEFVACSDDCEILEITMPAEFGTQDAEAEKAEAAG